MNKVLIDGRIMANTEKIQDNYKFFEGNEATGKKSVLKFTISSQKNYGKPDANGYYPTCFYVIKAFGPKADFINRCFKPGDSIMIEGSLEVEPGGETAEGTRYSAKTVIYVDNAYFPSRGSNDTKKAESSTATSSAPAQAASSKKATSASPF